MSAIISGLIGGLVATALGAAALRSQKSDPADHSGWKSLRPGWYLHFALLGCLAFVVAITYFFAIGGSARPDAKDQNFYALLLMLGFGAGGVWVLWAGYLRTIAWRGNNIRLSAPFRRDAYYRFSDVVGVSDSFDGAECKLHFTDGQILRVSVYFLGFHDFMDELGSHFSVPRPSQVDD